MEEERNVILEDDDNEENGDTVVLTADPEEDMEEGELSESEQIALKSIEDKKSRRNGVERKLYERGKKDVLPDLVQGIDRSGMRMGQEELEKLERRRKKFGTDGQTVSTEEVLKLCASLDIPAEEREKGPKGKYLLECVLMYGVSGMTKDDIITYFSKHSVPQKVEFIDMDNAVVTFTSPLGAAKALIELSRPIGEPVTSQKIIKHVITFDDEEPEQQVITRNTEVEPDKYVHPSDIPLNELPGGGRWRFGNLYNKNEVILLRFAVKSDLSGSHYLANDRVQNRVFEVPAEVKEREVAEIRSRKEYDRKNPWGAVAEEWAGSVRGPRREYEIQLSDMDKPPRRMRLGPKDWDDPQDESDPIRLYQPRESAPGLGSALRSRLGKRQLESDEDDMAPETYISHEEDSDDSEINWSQKNKKPRMGMVADMEEKKILKRANSGVKSRLHGGIKEKKTMIKRKFPNNQYIVNTEILEDGDYTDTGDEMEGAHRPLGDLRESLSMRVSVTNRDARPMLTATRKITERFGSGRMASRLGGKYRDYSDDDSGDSLERDQGEGLGREVDNMLIQVKRGSSEELESEDNSMETDNLPVERVKRAATRRERMVQQEDEEEEVEDDDEDEEEREEEVVGKRRSQAVRVKEEEEIENENRRSRREREQAALESRKRQERDKELLEKRRLEIEVLKEQEQALLLEKERKLRELERKRDKEKAASRREEQRERREVERREVEKREAEQKRRERERERARAKERLRAKAKKGSSSRRRVSDSSGSDESSSSGDDSSSSSNSDDEDESSSSSSSSSSDGSDTSSSESSSSDSSDSEEEEKRRKRKKQQSSSSKSKSGARPSSSSKLAGGKSSDASRKHGSSKSGRKREGGSSSKQGSGRGADRKSSDGKAKSSGGDVDRDDGKKAGELRDKLQNYLKRAKEVKEEKEGGKRK